jgi:hypothetical protein
MKPRFARGDGFLRRKFCSKVASGCGVTLGSTRRGGGKTLTPSFAIAVKKGSKSLVGSLNGAIEELKTHGVIDKILSENIARVEAAAAKQVY